MALVLAVPSLKKFSDDDMSASFWNEVVGKQMGFQAEATRIHESLASEFGLITVGCLKQPWVTLTMIETAVVKATQSETHPEGRRGWMRSIQHLLQHQFSTMAPGAPVSAALAISGSLTCGTRLPLYAPKDGLKLGEKLKLEGTLDEIRLPGVLDTMEYETENPFVADLSANDTKEISKHVFLQRALADNYVSGDKEVEKKYAKLLKAKYLGKPAFSGDWKKILKGRAAMGRRTSASVRHPAPLCLYSCTAPPCCTTLTVFCSSQTIYSKSLKDMVDQADIDAKIRDGSLESLYLGSITVGSQEPKYYSHHKENVSPGSALATAIVQTAPANVVLPPTWSDALKKPAAAPLIAPSIAARKLSPRTKSANLSQLREEATAASNIPRPPCYGEEPMPHSTSYASSSSLLSSSLLMSISSSEPSSEPSASSGFFLATASFLAAAGLLAAASFLAGGSCVVYSAFSQPDFSSTEIFTQCSSTRVTSSARYSVFSSTISTLSPLSTHSARSFSTSM